MATPSINLKSLEFQQIKNELVTYFQSVSEFSDYDFEGSILSTIMDLLAYNTFYQIMFQNILVNEMFLDSSQKLESLISHAKLLGYVIPGKISSTATLKASGSAATSIPAYTAFRATKNNGETRLFYNTEEIDITDNGSAIESDNFSVYEGDRLIKQTLFPFDVDTQSVSIPEKNIDFRTIKVEVSTNAGASFVTYAVGTSTEPSISQNPNICFLERTSTGYKVIFTGTYDSDTGVYTTSDFSANVQVKLTFVVPSGLEGNNCSGFSLVNNPNSLTLTSVSGLSVNGKDAPSIDTLKLNLPRVFSASSRVVSADDIKSFLVENGYGNSISEWTVVGGEDLTPQELGTVYFSKTPDDLTPDQKDQAEIELKSKGMVGISYVYGTGT